MPNTIETYLYGALLWVTATSIPVVLFILMFVPAPYGRYTRPSFGPTIDRRLGWLLMEAPAPLVFALCFVLGNQSVTVVTLVFLLMWEGHYLHRAFVYPFTTRGRRAHMTLVTALAGLIFNVSNGYLNGRTLSYFGERYPNAWLSDPRFIMGTILFIAGFAINRKADAMLRALRAPGEVHYKIPRGWLFERVSCPNYLGEIIQWSGWALCTWSCPGLVFAFFSTANLLPRALAHHRWYCRELPDYPCGRRALIPFLL
jgi:steroid 5-alpha-reductase/3-oxo-5-alpha-steroid 4-dehydrogenase 1